MSNDDKPKKTFLTDFEEALYKCNKCGFCQTSCKVYKTHLNEAYAPRGRNRLIKSVQNGTLSDEDPEFLDAINSCLLCQECSVTCPSGVKPHELVLAARRYLAIEKGLPISKRIALNVLANPNKRKMAFKAARAVCGSIISKIEGFDGFRGIDVKGMPISGVSFLDQATEVNTVPDAKKRLGFYVGCFINHTLPGTGHSIVKVLNKGKFNVIIPKDQVCCGTPQHAYGDYETAKKNARKTIKQFAEFDAVITGCASCGAMLKKEYVHLFSDEPDFLDEVQKFSSKVFDFSEFVVANMDLEYAGLKAIHKKVTYHDGCHMSRGQGVREQPRKILKSIPRLQYVEMKEADRCCGAAGLFQGYFHEFAENISRQKVNNIDDTAAETVITGCPACLHRIQGSLRLAGKKQKVVHIADLLAQAFEDSDSVIKKREE